MFKLNPTDEFVDHFASTYINRVKLVKFYR